MAPKQKPGRSKQDYHTPPEFLRALERRLGIVGFSIDLAASAENSVAPQYFDEEENALEQPWNRGGGWAFCNPPFGDLRPWVKKAACEAVENGAQIAMLVPASVGANWWSLWVYPFAYVTYLNGRISFDGISPYPKDCAVLLYAPYLHGGSTVWTWK